MEKNKLRVIKDYEKLSKELQEQLKLVYPEGFSEHLIEFKNSKNDTVLALPFETDEKIYMIRMSVRKAIQLIEDDLDYDDDGVLKKDVQNKYKGDHADVAYLSKNKNYEE